MTYEPSAQFHDAANFVSNAPQLKRLANDVKLEVGSVAQQRQNASSNKVTISLGHALFLVVPIAREPWPGPAS